MKVARGKDLTGPVKLELVLPNHIHGLRVEPLLLAADQTHGTLTLHFDRDHLGPFNMPLLLRATLTDASGPIIAESKVETSSPTIEPTPSPPVSLWCAVTDLSCRTLAPGETCLRTEDDALPVWTWTTASTHAMAACVLFRDWLDAAPGRRMDAPRRADAAALRTRPVLPPRTAVFARRTRARLDEIQTVVVDGYVWLQDQHTPGLGAAPSTKALERQIAVVGVAKTCFQSTPAWRKPCCAGESIRPLYVTSAGLDLLTASACVRRMHGAHRLPTLLKRVDLCCRNA